MAALLHTGAGEESRTLDLNLGKVALYQLSYSRFVSFAAMSFATGRHYRDAELCVKDECRKAIRRRTFP